MSGPNYSRVWSIYEMLTPKPKDLLDSNRFYIREGEIYVWDEKQKKRKKRYAFLFNDIMLLTKKEGSKRFWLRVFITLRSPFVDVEDISTGMNSGFKLLCRTRTFLFFTLTPELNKSWMSEVHDSAKGNHDKRAKGEDVSNNSTAAASPSAGPSSSKRTTSSAGFSAGADPIDSVSPSRSRVNNKNVFSYDSSIANDSITAQVSFDSGAKLDTLRPIEENDQVVPVLSPPPRSRTSSRGKSSANIVTSPNGTAAKSPSSPTSGGGSLLDDFIDFESESKQQEKAYRAQMQQQQQQSMDVNPFGAPSVQQQQQPLVAANTNPALASVFAPQPAQSQSMYPQQQQQQQQMYQMQLLQQQQQQLAYQQQMQMQMQQMSLQQQHQQQSQAASFNPFMGGMVAQPQQQQQPFFGGATAAPVATTTTTPLAPTSISSYSSPTYPAATTSSPDPFAGLWEQSKSSAKLNTTNAPPPSQPRPATATTTNGSVDFPF